MNQLNSGFLKVNFDKNSYGDFLSKAYPSAQGEDNLHAEGVAFNLYVELGESKWDVHGIPEYVNDCDVGSLVFVGKVQAATEEEFLEWFPLFSAWTNKQLPLDFAKFKH